MHALTDHSAVDKSWNARETWWQLSTNHQQHADTSWSVSTYPWALVSWTLCRHCYGDSLRPVIYKLTTTYIFICSSWKEHVWLTHKTGYEICSIVFYLFLFCLGKLSSASKMQRLIIWWWWRESIFGRVVKEAVVSQFKILPRRLSRGSEVNREVP